MSSNTESKVSLEEKYNDYEKTPVPEQARQTWYQQGMVWLGAGFGLSGLATGGVLADGLSFKDMLLVSIIGSIIFGALYIASNYIIGISFAEMKLLKLLPYVITVIVLIVTSIIGKKETQPPASLGVNYFREDR